MAKFDLVLRGGHVVDGTGIPRYTADVGLRDGRIAEIGHMEPTNGLEPLTCPLRAT